MASCFYPDVVFTHLILHIFLKYQSFFVNFTSHIKIIYNVSELLSWHFHFRSFCSVFFIPSPQMSKIIELCGKSISRNLKIVVRHPHHLRNNFSRYQTKQIDAWRSIKTNDNSCQEKRISKYLAIQFLSFEEVRIESIYVDS